MTPTKTAVLLVGGGVASVRCARTLRRSGFDGSIVLVGSERMLPYNRPPLSKEVLRDDVPDELLLAETATWYERRGIETRLGRQVVAVDPAARRATLDDGAEIEFEQCLIATGAEPRLLPVAGADRTLVLRTVGDARRIGAALTQGTRVAIVGGGFIGVEVASSLAARGALVTVVELAEELWGGSLGPELASWARGELERIGVSVMTGAAVSGVADGRVEVGDRSLDADVVIAAVGVAPRVDLARDAGLAVHDGVVTDLHHRTERAGIFAAGDVARVAGHRVEHWHAAREGGERAAIAMLGGDPLPIRVPWIFSEVAGRAIDVFGALDGWDEAGWIADRSVLAYLSERRLAGLAVIDAAIPAEQARQLVGERAAPDSVASVLRG